MARNWEAWLGRTRPTVIARPLYKSTATDIIFTVLDEERNAVDITGYSITFSARTIKDETALFDPVTCTLTTPASGICTASLSVSDLSLSTANGEDCYGELNLRSGGSEADIDDRVQYRFIVEDAIETT